jgi:hypothetical protein
MNAALRKVSIVTLTLIGTFIGYLAMQPADLRDAGITEQVEQDGRTILEKMAETHGSTNYHRQARQTFRFTNTWEALPGAVYRPWAENGQSIEMTCTTGVHLRAETRFLSGANADKVWGVRDKSAYTRQNPEATPVYARDANIELWLSTFQFLFELPFRVDYYPIVADMGMGEIDGQRYRKVFITWEDERPSNAYDQLVFWINSETNLLEKAHYTCRDSGFGFFTATIHYHDYTQGDGYWVPQSADITFGGPKDRYFGQQISLHHIDMLTGPNYEAAKLLTPSR